ncbi:MAG: Mrp/NBP35 family ATP-binding protein [Candidatus Eiseniibacteriota bacterium]|nr:MAG: Mrp/NBP35 family ATP-binding protein [Candidatus Eisenbacteria bacterium]
MQLLTEKDRREQDERIKKRMSRIKYKFIVISGKGGVGKTTVSINLAYGLATRGHGVGILDVDIHGPNTPKMLGVESARLTFSEEGIEPIDVLPNLKVVSLSLFGQVDEGPVIWRGPLKMGIIKQMLADVHWGDLDYMIVDSPPGTGDEPLSVCQLIPDIVGAIIVTTPQDVAILDSRKSVLFAQKLSVPVVGIIENMSGFACPHCARQIDLFGTGGGERAAQDLKVPFLGRIPIEPDIVKLSDSGEPFVHFRKGTATAGILDEIIEKIIAHVRAKPPADRSDSSETSPADQGRENAAPARGPEREKRGSGPRRE